MCESERERSEACVGATLHVLDVTVCVCVFGVTVCGVCRLSSGQHIQMLTALVLQLIQCTVTAPEVTKGNRAMSSNKSKEGDKQVGDKQVGDKQVGDKQVGDKKVRVMGCDGWLFLLC